MKWTRGRRSRDLVDKRRSPAATGAIVGGGAGVIAIIALVVTLLGGGGSGGLGDILGQLQGGAAPAGAAGSDPIDPAHDPDRDLVDFMSFVLDDIQSAWTQIFEVAGSTYERTELVLFTGSVQSGCGGATSAIGPHYCPLDRTVYLDLDFFRELSQRFGAPGDFAQAYVIAHEIGHHVQNLIGLSDKVRNRQQEYPEEANDLSVKLELQADCFAGVWAYTTFQRDILENGDLEEGLQAAAAVGDDRLQKEATGSVNPESWTHGSSAQRSRWFQAGFDQGDPNACDTFSGTP